MYHLLGQAVAPLRWDAVAATIFTDPQIATVGLSEQRAAETGIVVEVDTLPLAGNSRAKMSNRPDGFVKLLARPGSGTIAGGAVVASYASDLIAPISEACFNRLTASQLAQAFQTYPSFAGSIQECARRLAVRVQGPTGTSAPSSNVCPGWATLLDPRQTQERRVASDERHPCPPGCGWGWPEARQDRRRRSYR